MPIDTGTQLRSMYEPEGGVREIFSSKVTDYAASRPDYPAPLFESLRVQCNLHPGAMVADIGAGTGLLTQGFLARGYNVTAIEPNAAMRTAADQLLARYRAYRSTDGAAESIPMATASVDLITAAQAFHWFDIENARTEFLRVLRPDAKVALIWNDRVLTEPLHGALDEVFSHYGGAKRSALVAHEERGDIPRFFGTAASVELTWQHEHHLNESGLLSLVFSRSYMPERSSTPGQEACQQIGEIFRRFAVEGKLTVRYITVAIIGRPQSRRDPQP
jgi:SAM-dependent methyltransferase